MADRKSATGSEDPRVSAALADYLQRVDRGEPVSVDDFLAQHAEIAGDLRLLLVTSEELANLQPAGPAAPPGPEVSTRSVAEQNVETVAPQRVQKRASAETLLQQLPDTFGRYRIVRPLGSGAMGDVYLAEDSQLHRKVALKTPSFDADETGELLERFYREARSAAVLRHSNICPVFDVGEINGRHYISMAYIEGQPLSAYIRPDKPQPERQALAVIRKLALALQDAHDHGIIHRDLKPGNVMIDRKGEPIVMDFGLARPVQSEAGARLTQSGMLVGSPAYMSPQQVEGDPSILTPSTDQYSLGVMLYELLTGNLPFRGGMTAVIAAILTKQPTPPGQLRADLDPRIEALCLKMMSKSPADRFRSLREVADAISTILKSDPVRPAARSTAKAAAVAETAPVAKPKRTPTAAATAAPAAAAAVSITASNVESLLDAANKCMRKHDYEQVVSMLDAIPERKRTDQVRALLAKAQELSDEVAFLLSEIDEALRLNDSEALGKKSDALLKLKPKHHKALQIKEELSRYGKGRVWQAGGWTPDGRRIGEGSWIPWLPLSIGACVFGISLLCVMLYLRVGDAVVRVRINHPDVEVGIQDRTLNIRSATQDIKVEPGEDTLKVSFQGADFETQKFTLSNGENPAIVIELLDKTLSAKFGDLSIGAWPVELDSPVASPEPARPQTTESVMTDPVGVRTPLPDGAPGEVATFAGHTDRVMAVQVLPNGKQAISCGYDGTVRLWELATGTQLHAFNHEKSSLEDRRRIVLLALSSDGRTACSASREEDAVYVWDVDQRSLRCKLKLSSSRANLDCLGFDESAQRVLTIADGVLREWSIEDGQELRQVQLLDGEHWWKFSSNGRYILCSVRKSGQETGTVEVWDRKSAVRLHSVAVPLGDDRNGSFRKEVSQFEITPDGLILITGGTDSFVRVWSTKTGAQSSAMDAGGGDRIHAVHLSADARFLLTGSGGQINNEGNFMTSHDRTVRLWDLRTNAQLQQFAGHQNHVHQVVLTPDHRFAVSASSDKTARVWRLPSSVGIEFRNIPELTASANSGGWTDLFNGRDLTGWEMIETTGPQPSDQSVHSPASGGWTVNPTTRELVCETDNGGWLKSHREYGDFELQLEFNLPSEGNSGLLIRSPDTGHLPKSGMEVQIVDPALTVQGDQPQWPTGSIQYSAARTDIQAARPSGEWNAMTVRCTGNELIVNLNGRRVNEIDVTADPQLNDRPRRGFVGLYNWLGKAKGTRFRNIRIREL